MKGFKILLLVALPHLILFLGLLYYFYQQSGGDIGLSLFTVISFVLYVMIWGGISFMWSWKKKMVIIIGLIIIGIIEALIFRLIT